MFHVQGVLLGNIGLNPLTPTERQSARMSKITLTA